MEERTRLALKALRKILRTTEQNSKHVMRETGLTPSQLIFMQLLEDGREHTAGFIASSMGITQATTTALLQRLEAHGMIQRRRIETDRRQVWLSLTEAGQKALSIAPDGVHAKFHEQFSALAVWEQAMLIASLERIAAMLGNHQEEDFAAVLDGAAILPSDEKLSPDDE